MAPSHLQPSHLNDSGRNKRRQNQTANSGRRSSTPAWRRRRQSTPVLIIKWAITVILLALLAGFCILLARTGMLPRGFLIAIYILLGLLYVIIMALLWTRKRGRGRRGTFIAGMVLSIIYIVGLAAAYLTLDQAVDVLRSITSRNYAVSHVGVYVLKDDPAQGLNDVSGYTFGIMKSMGREAVDATIDNLNDTMNTNLWTVEYDSIKDLIDGLSAQRVQAVIVDRAHLEVLEEEEGYEDLESQLREITLMRIELEIGKIGKDDYDANSPFTVYISGIDSRAGLVAESRTDVNIVATVNPQTHQVLLVSTPRDYYVPLSISNGQNDKLTHAGLYGITVAEQTMEMLYDIDIDYYFRVSFDGFESIIDALGGITVNSDQDFWDYTNTYHFTEGTNYMNGAAALAFARERKAFSDGDRARGKHQMEVIRAVANKLLSPDLLKGYSSIMSAVEGSFETDIPYDLITDLVQGQLSGGGDWDIDSYSVNGTSKWDAVCYSLPGERYVLIPDETTVDTAKQLMQQVRDGMTVDVPAS